MTERRALARDIWKAGVKDPDLLAEYLIRQGWGKRNAAFTQGVTSAVVQINMISEPNLKPSLNQSLLQRREVSDA